jgi:hypothetical protein
MSSSSNYTLSETSYFLPSSTIVLLGAKQKSWFPGTRLTVEVKCTVSSSEISARDLQKPFGEYKSRNSFLWANAESQHRDIPVGIFSQYKLIGASPLTKCRFSHSLLQLRRILGGMGGGGLKKGGNAQWAMKSQRCTSSASLSCCCVAVLLSCCQMYIPDLPWST